MVDRLGVVVCLQEQLASKSNPILDMHLHLWNSIVDSTINSEVFNGNCCKTWLFQFFYFPPFLPSLPYFLFVMVLLSTARQAIFHDYRQDSKGKKSETNN